MITSFVGFNLAMNIHAYIASDPDICHGQPFFLGTRVLVSSVLEMLEAGQTHEQIASAFPGITSKHIQAALHLAAQLIPGEQFIRFKAA
jgi:uncharacterized protein (DUF433 family)